MATTDPPARSHWYSVLPPIYHFFASGIAMGRHDLRLELMANHPSPDNLLRFHRMLHCSPSHHKKHDCNHPSTYLPPA